MQVGIGRGEAAGVGAGLHIGGMDAARFGVDVVLKRVGVGRFELGQLPPVEDAGGQVVFRREVFEDVGGGRILAGLALLAARKRHFVKEDFADLCG